MKNIGDIIKWRFEEERHIEIFGSKVYESEVCMVDKDEKVYGVYAEYGQDLIPFDKILNP